MKKQKKNNKPVVESGVADVHPDPKALVEDIISNIEEADNEYDTKSLPEGVMTLDEHLSELRKTLIHILLVSFCFTCVAFIWKDWVFRIILAPSKSNFVLYRWINSTVEALGLSSMRFDDFTVQMINTKLASQFMTHISMSFYFGLLAASPYIVYKIFCFVRPALYKKEQRYSTTIVLAIYVLFALGLLMNYFIIFPISFRFLGTYQVDTSIINTIALSSYISSFTLLSLMMGLVFEIPVLAFVLGKMDIISSNMLANYRKVAFIGLLLVSAFITPPDVFTLILMIIPLYGLYEVSIWILKCIKK